jgi:hypothetical protein
MTPMTPSGVRTRSICRPFGRSHSAMTSPTGSRSSAIARGCHRPWRDAASFSVSRSMKEASYPLPGHFQIEALAARMSSLSGEDFVGHATGAAFLRSVDAIASGGRQRGRAADVVHQRLNVRAFCRNVKHGFSFFCLSGPFRRLICDVITMSSRWIMAARPA